MSASGEVMRTEQRTEASVIVVGGGERNAAALAAGKTVEEYAEARGISYQTARTQLKSVMAKTYTNRQGELVALLLRSMANNS